MESKNEFKKIDIKNRMCYYFDEMMKVEDIDVGNILLDEKSYENILVYNILYKKFMDAKPLLIRFDKVDGIIKIYHGIRYLDLSNSYNEFYYRINSRIHNAIFDRINLSQKSDDKYSFNNNFARIRMDSYNSLPIENKLTLQNVIILIKSVFNKDKNNHYYNIFLEKSNTQYFQMNVCIL